MLEKLRRLIGRNAGSFWLALTGSLAVSGAMSLLNPLLLKFIFDEGIIKKDFRLFALVTGGFVLLATVSRLFSLWNAIRVQDLKNSVLSDLLRDMLGRYYDIPYRQIAAHSPGYYSSRIYDEAQAASGSAIDLSFALVSSAVSFAASLAVVLYVSAKATLALALTVPVLLFLSGRYTRAIKKHSAEEKENEGLLRGAVTSAAQAYRTVNIFGLLDEVRERVLKMSAAYIASVTARLRSSATHNTLGAILMSYGEMLVILVCGYAILKGEMTFGGFMAFMNAFWIAVGSLRSLVQKVPEISKVSVALERLESFGRERRDTRMRTGSGQVSLRGAAFSFGDKEVFSGLDLSVRMGESLLLLGPNGSGKSTVANMLAGFLEPARGEAETFSIGDISACIAPHNFIPGTVRDNLEPLARGNSGYLARLIGDLSLTECLDKSAAELSAGQKKKVEVAMGLLKEASLYIFDEPLANVDTESKKVIMDRIFERASGKALVVIMHGDEEFRTRFSSVASFG